MFSIEPDTQYVASGWRQSKIFSTLPVEKTLAKFSASSRFCSGVVVVDEVIAAPDPWIEL